jgi:hypothetical protein
MIGVGCINAKTKETERRQHEELVAGMPLDKWIKVAGT